VIGESFADSGGKLGGHRLERFSCSCQRILPGRAFALGFGGMQIVEFISHSTYWWWIGMK
jgi:hypothetical protein